MQYLCIFSKRFSNLALIFCAFSRKIQTVVKFWEMFENFRWKFERKMEFLLYIFYLIFRKFLTNNKHSEITPFFFDNFFRFRVGGGFPLLPPGYALDRWCHFEWDIKLPWHKWNIEQILSLRNISKDIHLPSRNDFCPAYGK